MRSAKEAFIYLIAFLCVYSLFGFVLWEFNSKNWTEETRFTYVMVLAMVNIMIGIRKH